MLPESKLGRDSSLQEWQWMYPEQISYTEYITKLMGNKNQSKKHCKKTENLIFKQKYIIN